MRRSIIRIAPLFLLALGPAFARQDPTVCGTDRERWREQLHFHRQAALRRTRQLRALGVPVQAQAEPAAGRDIGEIAVLEDTDGVVSHLNEFNLDQRTLTFWGAPGGAASYTFRAGDNSYDPTAAASGSILAGLGDDDTRSVPLPFAFPFFGKTYKQIYVNSDGNLTFEAGDGASAERSLGRMTAGPPRIAPLYRDLDPSASSAGISVFSASDRFVVSWVKVPEYSDTGTGPLQTFQVRLFPDGRIEIAYSGISTTEAVAGISPGRLAGSTSVLSLLAGSSQQFTATIAERFGTTNELDVVMAAQKFYQLHDDAYDYLVFFNNMGISPGGTAVSWEMTVRNNRTGYGDGQIDIGTEFGSASRLQSVLNMGPLSQYPTDPNAIVDSRAASRDTPVTVIAHEAGHLFLAYASIRDPYDSKARPMLGYQLAHWAFTFNSEASLLEGNRIRDNQVTPQPGITQRFSTVGVTEGFSPLDQYLMGLRTADEVPGGLFVAKNATVSALRHPQLGVNFNGDRQDISVQDVLTAEGRRTPDSTVSQRHYRFAFVLVTPKGATPSSAELQKLDTFRQQFEGYFQKATGGRAWADTVLRRAVRLSVAPAAGVVQGMPLTATVSLQTAADAPVTVYLKASGAGIADMPAQVTVPKGESRATFTVTGNRAGVEELTATPADPSRYETAYARIQVMPSMSSVKLVRVPGGPQADAVQFRATDINALPYAGLQVRAAASGGTLDSATAITDENGIATFRWIPSGTGSQLTAALDGGPSVSIGNPSFTAGSVVNAASYQPGLAPGGLASLFGSNLSDAINVALGPDWPSSLGGVTLLVNGKPAPLLMVSQQQINFLVPADTPPGNATLAVNSAAGNSAAVQVQVSSVAPGIFFDSGSGYGAVLAAGTGKTTVQRPAAQGEFLEIYTTGLGPVHNENGLAQTDLPVQVFIGGVEANVTYSGLAPGYTGLYQVNARVPAAAPGALPLTVVVDGKRSNEVKVQIR